MLQDTDQADDAKKEHKSNRSNFHVLFETNLTWSNLANTLLQTVDLHNLRVAVMGAQLKHLRLKSVVVF